MLISYVTGVLALVAIVVAWVAVQRGWGRAFPEAFDDPDVLVERSGCHGCGCTLVCQRRRRERPGAQEERA